MFDFSGQHPLRRFVIALWACWFVVLIGEPAVLHSCPMHDGPGAVGAVGSAGAHSGHQMSHMPGMATGGKATAPTGDQGAPEEAAPHACTCIGACSASVTVAPATQAPLSWLAGIIDIAPVLHIVHQLVPVEPDFVLPFANGPPSMSWSRNA